jgi:hypothetical protein
MVDGIAINHFIFFAQRLYSSKPLAQMKALAKLGYVQHSSSQQKGELES